MSEQKKYKILIGTNIDTLELDVNKHISSGWIPQGGVNVSNDRNSGNRDYFQAMIFKS